jgi:import inner membrane translocase subunit TIM21
MFSRSSQSAAMTLGTHKLHALASSRRLLNTTRKILNQQRHTGINLYYNQQAVFAQNLRNNTIRSKQSSSIRRFSDDKSKGASDETRSDIVLTPGQKVVAGTRLTLYLGMLGAGLVCLYAVARELIPTKMSPNTVFSNAHSALKDNPDVAYRFGSPIKTYGKDHGGKREGRRNFIEHSEYTNEEDGSKRIRVRFNLEGPKGRAFVFAEVSKDMPSGEFVYLLVQDKNGGSVITVVDNRSMLAAKRMAAGSKEGEDVFASLLGGGKR